MFKCNICGKDAEFIYEIKSPKRFDNINISNQLGGKLLGTVFFCESHYIDALKNNW